MQKVQHTFLGNKSWTKVSTIGDERRVSNNSKCKFRYQIKLKTHTTDPIHFNKQE